jgi:hypothetical protein
MPKFDDEKVAPLTRGDVMSFSSFVTQTLVILRYGGRPLPRAIPFFPVLSS